MNAQLNDELYDALLAAHEGLDTTRSAALNARLILLLMEKIGSREDILNALREARRLENEPLEQIRNDPPSE